MTILKKIVERKREEVAERQASLPMEEVIARARHTAETRGFARSLKARAENREAAVIAEIKKHRQARA